MAKTPTRIQQKNQRAILTAALEVFSKFGFRGSTLDQVAATAGLSKPNVLYYFSSKEAIYSALLTQLLDNWLAPLTAINPKGDPVEELLAYAQHKLRMSEQYPRESRLFAMEILQGAPQVGDLLRGELRETIDDLAAVINGWVAADKIRPVDPYHLVFTIWSVTQHYADFDVQVRAIMDDKDPILGAQTHVDAMLRRLLTP